ncbi:MAG: prenyltransferase [Deltaproteobacteria bacterium]|nr:prenyltransferase [Deltaproteobacteria bacterium]
MEALAAFIRLGRPLFLGGGFVMFALGTAVAAHHGVAIDLRRYVLGQLAVTAFQLMTHYANDYFDYDADRANATPTRWSGGSRVLANGELPREVALVAALALAAGGVALSVALALDAPPLALPALLLMLALAWAYSAPPLRLCASGLGELDTALVVTGLVPWLGYYLQAPDLRALDTLLLAIAPLALLQVAMLLAIEFPDADGDRATGKRTLVVRLGAARAARLYVVITVAAYAYLAPAHLAGLPAVVALAAAIPAPLALWRAAAVADHRDHARHERLTFFAVFLLVATAACELVAFVLLAM